MKIESLTPAEVKRLVGGRDFLAGPVIPITGQRAGSQLLNPDLEENDVILNIARDEQDRIIGFIGALPGSFGGQGRFAWNSGWWVDPVKGRQAAMPLFYRFLEQWDMRVMFSDLTPLTSEILGRMSFIRTSCRKGIRLYYRSVLAKVLVPRSPGFKKIGWLLAGVDFVLNLLAALYRAGWKLMVKKTGIPVREREGIDHSTGELIEQTREPGSIPRDREQLEWIIAHPWILRENRDEQQDKYPFSSFDPGFEQKLLRIGTAFLMVTIHDRHLKVPYIYYEGEAVLKDVAGYLNRLAVNKHVTMLSSYHPGLSRALRKVRGPVLFRKPVTRYTACSDVLYNLSGEGFFLQDGDGDAAFT
jgi:hypothetical protein